MSRRRSSLRVGREIVIPPGELVTEGARSGGPGGQNVNKVESKVILRFDLRRSRALTEDQRRHLVERLSGRLTREGELVLHASQFRERARNESAARQRLAGILLDALTPPAPRKPTRPPRSAGEKRLTAKRMRSRLKRTRRGNDED